MGETNLPATVEGLKGLATQNAAEVAKVFADVSKTGDYLPRLQLMTSNSEACKNGSVPVNNYALVQGKNFRVLGGSVDCFVLAFRPQALDINGDQIISVHDPEHAEFKRIQETSKTPNSGCMFGPEYLVWVGAAKEFATFFMGNPSARNESPNVQARLGDMVTLKSQKIDSKKFTWFAPQALPCTTPMELPAIEIAQKEIEKFLKPKAPVVEKAPEAAAGRER